MTDEWKSLCKLPEWSFTKFMSSESEMLALKAQGLAADGILITFIFNKSYLIQERFIDAECAHIDALTNYSLHN